MIFFLFFENMIEIVINFDSSRNEYKIYEPTTDTLMASSNLTEALCLLNKFIESSGLSSIPNILECPNISYHLDSATMKAMIESNIALIKRLQTAPSGFTQSNRKFGGQTVVQQKPKDNFQKSNKNKTSMSYGFSGADGFRKSFKKFKGNSKF